MTDVFRVRSDRPVVGERAEALHLGLPVAKVDVVGYDPENSFYQVVFDYDPERNPVWFKWAPAAHLLAGGLG